MELSIPSVVCRRVQTWRMLRGQRKASHEMTSKTNRFVRPPSSYIISAEIERVRTAEASWPTNKVLTPVNAPASSRVTRLFWSSEVLWTCRWVRRGHMSLFLLSLARFRADFPHSRHQQSPRRFSRSIEIVCSPTKRERFVRDKSPYKRRPPFYPPECTGLSLLLSPGVSFSRSPLTESSPPLSFRQCLSSTSSSLRPSRRLSLARPGSEHLPRSRLRAG